MTQPFGIDTSVLVRLTTKDPEAEFQHCIEELRILVEDQGCEVFVSNGVIGEAYLAVQHHYQVSDEDARATLIDVLSSGLVTPLNGQSVILALKAYGGPDLFDRLIADDYSRAGMETLTLDRRTSSLPRVRSL